MRQLHGNRKWRQMPIETICDVLEDREKRHLLCLYTVIQRHWWHWQHFRILKQELFDESCFIQYNAMKVPSFTLTYICGAMWGEELAAYELEELWGIPE